jgi:WD40 repeat protein
MVRSYILGLVAVALLAPVSLAQEGGEFRDLVRVRKQREDEPWLRLDPGGHTATVRSVVFSPDGSRLITAGLDKDVRVWNLGGVARDLVRRQPVIRERVLRWPVVRGPRGSIYTLAVAANDGLMAIAGYGARTEAGEIFVFNPLQGTLEKILVGHDQSIVGLAWSPDGQQLASADILGKVIVWDRATWQPKTVRDVDTATYGAPRAAWLFEGSRSRPIAFVNNTTLAIPVLTSARPQDGASWRIAEYDPATGVVRRTLTADHPGEVSALATSADGRWIASADGDGKIVLWDKTAGNGRRLNIGRLVVSLAFDKPSKRLAIGTDVDGTEPASVLVLDVNTRAVAFRRSVPDPVMAVSFSPDGKRLAYSGGASHEVFLTPIDNNVAGLSLAGTGRPVYRVAFSKQEPLTHIAIGTERGAEPKFNNLGPLTETFSPTNLQLDRRRPAEADFVSPTDYAGDWSLRFTQADGSWRLYEGNTARAQLPLEDYEFGSMQSYCFIPDANGKPIAVAVGGDLEGGIYVFGLDRGPQAQLLRHFRGHYAIVNSLGVSADGRLLVSGSGDATAGVWSLSNLTTGGTMGRWGATFADQAGQLVVTAIDPAGPLFTKGVREGDVLARMTYVALDKIVEENRVDVMLNRLNGLQFDDQIVFAFTRAGANREPFVRLPAWPALATLFADDAGEWAFWTPEGFYDASINGNTIFGWQVNRGVDQLPDYFRADQYQARLERPDVMKRLLTAGNLQTALEEAAVQEAAAPKPVPAEPDLVLSQQIKATPRVRILTPDVSQAINVGQTRVRAAVDVPQGVQVVDARAFANGVIGSNAQLVAQEEVETGTRMTYEWDVPLPDAAENLVQVFVNTAAPTMAFSSAVVSRGVDVERERAPRIHILTMAVNTYADEGIAPLAFAVADAQAVAERVRASTASLYEPGEIVELYGSQVTGQNARAVIKALTENLKEKVRPNDLLFIYLAGHGVVDPVTESYRFVSHDFRMEQLATNDYGNCVGWEDLQLLAGIPCRKLALLDTCHSGAVQPLSSTQLKMAVRGFQRDVILTVSAAQGHELSEERDAWGHGVFTRCLLDAMSGHADTNRDGDVMLGEVVDYVGTTVPAITGKLQNPVAAPSDLLPYIRLPLTSVPDELPAAVAIP